MGGWETPSHLVHSRKLVEGIHKTVLFICCPPLLAVRLERQGSAPAVQRCLHRARWSHGYRNLAVHLSWFGQGSET